MNASPFVVRALIVVGAIVALGLLRHHPWRDSVAPTSGEAPPAAARESLVVGYLPVT